jgi:hypothetical protein
MKPYRLFLTEGRGFKVKGTTDTDGVTGGVIERYDFGA